jgi:hypothetical protein
MIAHKHGQAAQVHRAHQRLSGSERFGHRLFHQHGDAARKAIKRDRNVRGVGRGDDHPVGQRCGK